jgi:hypothetical protein
MMVRAAFAVTLLLLALVPPTPALAFTTKTSGVWSGYLLTGTTFTAVYGTWKQPTVTCPVDTARASFWIGIDGDITPTVEQVGTIAICNGAGKPVSYRAWWEMVGKPVGGQEPFAVSPGDNIQASVVYTGGAYVLAVKDLTNGQQFTTTQKCAQTPCQRATAEWIIERPGEGTYPLADYQEMTFTGINATEAPPPTQGISIIQYNMIHTGNTLSVCSLPANSSATKPPANIDCKWSGAQ